MAKYKFTNKAVYRTMKYVFADESREDYLYWQKTDKKTVVRINSLKKAFPVHAFRE